MFKIVVLVYVMVSGQPIDAPVAYDKRESFKGLDECQLYLKSPAFAVDRSRLSAFVTATIIKNQMAKAKEDETTPPLMDTAITASCEDDNRL